MDFQEMIRETEFDYVMHDGRVYLNADQISVLYAYVSSMLAQRAVALQDVIAVGSARGMATASMFLTAARSEILRREADAILNSE